VLRAQSMAHRTSAIHYTHVSDRGAGGGGVRMLRGGGGGGGNAGHVVGLTIGVLLGCEECGMSVVNARTYICSVGLTVWCCCLLLLPVAAARCPLMPAPPLVLSVVASTAAPPQRRCRRLSSTSTRGHTHTGWCWER
jgi:hypothetical protein